MRRARETVLVAFAEMTPDLRVKFIDGLKTAFGILSLSEAVDATVLWSHYASEHRGFVVGFNESHAFFDQRRGPDDDYMHLGSVSYRPPTSVNDLTELRTDNVFYCKSPEWSYEREWRMIMPIGLTTRTIGAPDTPIHLVSFPADAVECVVIGERSSAALVSELRGVLAHPDFRRAKVHRARADGPTGRLVIEPA